ncbi:MAG: CdaR family protein [Lachnospiraceae bacterium]
MKKILTNNLSMKLIAVFFAILLWLMIVNVDSPIDTRTYRNIEVKVTHDEIITNRGQTYEATEATQKVSVTVRAERKTLDRIIPQDIKAVADVRNIQFKKLIPIDVTIRGFEGKYEEANVTPKNMEITLKNNKTKSFTITVTTVGDLSPGYALGEAIPTPQKIEITGPDSQIDIIDKVVAKIDVTGLSEDTTRPAELILYDAGNNVIDQKLLSTDIANRDVSVSIHLLNSKALPVELDTSSITVADGFALSGVTFEPQTVPVVGTKENLEKIDLLSIPASALVMNEISDKTDILVDLIPHLPEEIALADPTANTIVVTATVERAGTKTLEIPVKSISVNNLANGLKADFGTAQTVELHFVGKTDALEALTQSSVAASIELSGKQEGSYEIPIQIGNLPKDCSIADQATVHITVTKK